MSGPEPKKCPGCHGQGWRNRIFLQRTGKPGRPPSVVKAVPCWTCNGSGVA